MKIGCCLNMLAQENDPIGIERLEVIAGLGFDYVELPLAQMMALPDKAFQQLVERVERANIPCRSCNNLFPGSLRLTGERVDLSAVRAYLSTALRRARQLGAQIVVFGSPAARNVEEGYPRELAMLQIIQALQIVDEYAGDGLCIVIEHVCKREGNIIYTVKEGCMVHEVCRAKNVAVLADTYHMGVEAEPVSDLRIAGPNLRHVHLANPNGRIYPAPGDGVDYPGIFRELHAIGYTGGVSIEAFTQDLKADAVAALRVLRSADACGMA